MDDLAPSAHSSDTEDFTVDNKLYKRQEQSADIFHDDKRESEFVLVRNSNPGLVTVGIVDYRQITGPLERDINIYDEPTSENIVKKDRPGEYGRVQIKTKPTAVSTFTKGPFHRSKKTQVHFSASDLAIRSMERVEEVMCLSSNSTGHLPKVKSLTLIKEKPSSPSADVVFVAENKVILHKTQEITIATSKQQVQEGWEVEPGFAIFKALNPIPYCPSQIKIAPQLDDISYERRVTDLEEKEQFEALLLGNRYCMEFMSPVEYAQLFVTNTIAQAKESYLHRIYQYGDPNKTPSRVVTPPEISTRYWSAIKKLNKEEGLFLIENYIVTENCFEEDWKYTISLEQVYSDKASDHFFYVANFSLPTKLYPVAQVTANLYFHMEVSRVIPPQCPIKVRFTLEGSKHQINPDKFTLRDNFLLRALDTKLKIFQDCNI